jgi:hypothetical protein
MERMDEKEIARLYHDRRLSLREVGKLAGKSGEGVRQILNASGAGTRRQEKRAGLMPNTLPTSLRLSSEAGRILTELEQRLGLKRSSVIELALRKLHQAEVGATAAGPARAAKQPLGRRKKK